jgi:hypothetical protein
MRLNGDVMQLILIDDERSVMGVLESDGWLIELAGRWYVRGPTVPGRNRRIDAELGRQLLSGGRVVLVVNGVARCYRLQGKAGS